MQPGEMNIPQSTLASCDLGVRMPRENARMPGQGVIMCVRCFQRALLTVCGLCVSGCWRRRRRTIWRRLSTSCGKQSSLLVKGSSLLHVCLALYGV